MNAKFKELIETLEPKCQALVEMTPVRYSALPKNLPKRAIYLFSENGQHLYVGRTNNLRNRLRNHCSISSPHNSAAFAFRIARETTGIEVSYTKQGSRASLCTDSEFNLA
jgi:excinuclease UvrABC nuclease subunit